MQSSEIKATCIAIRKGVISGLCDETFYKDRYNEFYLNYPTLFDACLNMSFPLDDYLDYMLLKKDELEDNKRSIEEADKEVYSHLNKQYVDPIITVPKGE